MLNQKRYLILHLCILSLLTYYHTNQISIYSICTTIQNTPILHLIHTLLILHLIYYTTDSIIYKYFGALRQQEIINLSDNISLFFTDLLLLLSVFEKDLSLFNIILLSVVLCIKSIVWISTYRLNHEYNVNIVYINVYTSILGVICYIIPSTKIFLIFKFEFGIIIVKSIKNLCICTMKIRDCNNPYIKFYIEIVSLVILLLVHIIFIFVTTIKYKLPINIFRGCVHILEKLIKKCKTLYKYDKICKELVLVQDVRIEEECPICTDEMVIGKRLLCGHVFHLECLKMWCENQHFCPICKVDLIK